MKTKCKYCPQALENELELARGFHIYKYDCIMKDKGIKKEPYLTFTDRKSKQKISNDYVNRTRPG